MVAARAAVPYQPVEVKGSGGRWRISQYPPYTIAPKTAPTKLITTDIFVEKWVPARNGTPGHYRKAALSASPQNHGERYNLTISMTGFADKRTLLVARLAFWAMKTRGPKTAQGYEDWAARLTWRNGRKHEVDHTDKKWRNTTLDNLRVLARKSNRNRYRTA